MILLPVEIDKPGLICFWDFQEAARNPRRSKGPFRYELRELATEVERVEGGIFGPYAARLGTERSLFIPRAECPALNFCGDTSAFTLVAWLRREAGTDPGCQAVAGMWNEHGKRQYCLFLNLGIWDSREQIGAHVSQTGGATPGYKYCMDAAIGKTPVELDKWVCAAISFDGREARAYLNGVLDEREGRNPLPYEGALNDAGDNGADFTVGAVRRPDYVDETGEHGSVVANTFTGLLGGLAIYGRALNEAEILSVCTSVKLNADPA